MELLNKIQQSLVCTKSQTNAFGKYKYRSCEDILEAIKPLLGDATLTLTDEVVCIGNRNYVKAKAILVDGDTSINTTAFACESESKKGMDSAQITGAASSYARKYALNGLFCIDDTKDADTQDNRPKADTKKDTPKTQYPTVEERKVLDEICNKLLDSLPEGAFLDEMKVQKIVFAVKGCWYTDISKAGAIAAYLISQDENMEKLTKAGK